MLQRRSGRLRPARRLPNACKPANRSRSRSKVALRDIPAGTYIRKYGIYIGRALQDIPAGASVHIHNVCSLCDHRSVTFKAENAAPQDMSYQLEEVRENV